MTIDKNIALGFKALEDRVVIEKVLNNELEIKSKGLGYSQHVIDSCTIMLGEIDKCYPKT